MKRLALFRRDPLVYRRAVLGVGAEVLYVLALLAGGLAIVLVERVFLR